MKAVFAITSQGNDFYAAMTRVAVASLRLSNPTMRLVVACDAESDLAMKHHREPLIDEVDEWLVVETPSGDAGFRNRFVKTSLRATVTGPFLFLDSDIFVRADLSEIFQLDTDIAGARNHSREAFAEQVWKQDRATLDAMGWEIGNKVYINGGVLFYNDTDGARRFGDEWHRRWMKSFAERSNFRDQPALNSALHAIQPRLCVLADRFNAQFKVSPWVAQDSVVWHYYSSAADVSHTSFELMVNALPLDTCVDPAKVKEIAVSQHPWRRSSWLDDYAARRIVHRGAFDRWEAAWLHREFSRYFGQRIRAKLVRAWRAVLAT